MDRTPIQLRLAATLALACLAWTPAMAQEEAEPSQDPFAPLRPFVGRWQGVGEGLGGRAAVEHRFELVLDDRFLEMRTRSQFGPGADGSPGEVHEDLGMFSYDTDQERLVWRQFLSEGYVNTYLLESSANGRQIWATESTEGAGGMGARVTLELHGDAEYTLLLELQPPGADFFECRSLRMRRAD